VRGAHPEWPAAALQTPIEDLAHEPLLLDLVFSRLTLSREGFAIPRSRAHTTVRRLIWPSCSCRCETADVAPDAADHPAIALDAKEALEEFALACDGLVNPGEHVAHVALGVVRMELDWPRTTERRGGG
jgi:hypothetical protein